jgi:hypothetical protein
MLDQVTIGENDYDRNELEAVQKAIQEDKETDYGRKCLKTFRSLEISILDRQKDNSK